MADGDSRDRNRYKISSYSQNGNCVEVDLSRADGLVAVRHSRGHNQPPLLFERAEWAAFIAGVANHEFDLD